MVSTSKYVRIIAVDDESPSPLLLLLLLLPFEGEAISAAPQAIGAARRRCDALVWVRVLYDRWAVRSGIIIAYKIQITLQFLEG